MNPIDMQAAEYLIRAIFQCEKADISERDEIMVVCLAARCYEFQYDWTTGHLEKELENLIEHGIIKKEITRVNFKFLKGLSGEIPIVSLNGLKGHWFAYMLGHK